MLINVLQESDYSFQEFLLTPLQLGIPNSRMRYYLLAKLKPSEFAVPVTNNIIKFIPLSEKMSETFIDNRGEEQVDENVVEPVSNYLESDIDEDSYLLTDKVLVKNVQVFDIVKKSSRRSCCFTKGYYHYAQGTGSILQMNEELDVIKHLGFITLFLNAHSQTAAVIQEAEKYKGVDEEKQLQLLRSLKLRYFTPREVSNLMGFPKHFGFPETSSVKQKYRTLGNSINVKLVSQLMCYLLKEPSRL